MEDPKDPQASRVSPAPQVPKASEESQDFQEPTELQGSRVSREIQVERDSQDPQASWDPAAPKVQWAPLAWMDSLAPPAYRGQSGPQGTGAFLEKCWGPSPGPGETLDCLDAPDQRALPEKEARLASGEARACQGCQARRASRAPPDSQASQDCQGHQDSTASRERLVGRGPWGPRAPPAFKVCLETEESRGTPASLAPWA